jgi:ABC-type branched-subunit amino acid transport system permease subunit
MGVIINQCKRGLAKNSFMKKIKSVHQNILVALIATMITSASLHIAIVTVKSITNKNISYLNPIEFLGINLVIPDYKYSFWSFIVGWLAILLIFFVSLLVLYRIKNSCSQEKSKPAQTI